MLDKRKNVRIDLKAVVFELSDIKNVHDGAAAAGFS
jgi:hypothetical protein